MGVDGDERHDTWIKVAHALLLHGQQMCGRPQGDFWPLSRGRHGPPDPKTCERNINRMTRQGGYFAKEPFRFGPGLGLVIGVSIGAESLRGALVDANGWVVPADEPERGDERAHRLDFERGYDDAWHVAELPPLPGQTALEPDALVDRIADVAWRVADRAFDDPRLLINGRLPLLGIAVAWPTPLRRQEKTPTSQALADLAWHEDGAPSVKDRVADRLGLDVRWVHAINDANAVALAAAFDEIRNTADAGDGRYGRTLLALRIGGGLGAGTVVIGSPKAPAPRSAFLEARLLEGASGFAGELGHLPVDLRIVDEVQSDPPPGLAPMPVRTCACGRSRAEPCLQTFASATAFVERMAASGIGVEGLLEGQQRGETSVMLSAMQRLADARQRRAQRDIGALIGRSLAAPVLLLNPTSITLTGSLAVKLVGDAIEQERHRWRHAHDDELPLRLLGRRANRFSAARGAAIAAMRGRLYRRIDKLDTPDEPLAHLTLKVTRENVAPWNNAVGWKLF